MWSPLGSSTGSQQAVWQSEPNTRGTWTILSSCLLTLLLCLWKAVHLNVPDVRDSTGLRFARKAGWLVLGMLAPEIVSLLNEAFTIDIALKANPLSPLQIGCYDGTFSISSSEETWQFNESDHRSYTFRKGRRFVG